MSAINLLPDTAFKPTAGLGGAIEGMRTSMALNQYDQEAEARNLANLAAQLKNLQAKKDEEAFGDLERALKGDKARYDSDFITSGLQRRKDLANIDQTEESTKTNVDTRIRNNKERSNKDATEAEAFANQVVQAFPDGVNDPFMWSQIRDRFNRWDVPLPENSSASMQFLRALSQNYEKNQGRQKEERDFSDKVNLEDLRASHARDRTEITARARVESAAARVAAGPKTAEADLILQYRQRANLPEGHPQKISWEEADAKIITILETIAAKETFGQKIDQVRGNPQPNLLERVQGAGTNQSNQRGTNELTEVGMNSYPLEVQNVLKNAKTLTSPKEGESMSDGTIVKFNGKFYSVDKKNRRLVPVKGNFQ